MKDLGSDVVVVGRRLRPTAKLVRGSKGEVLGRLTAEPPFLSLPAATGTVRLWALGNGNVLTLDARTWRTVDRREAPRGLAACWTPHGAVAVLGTVDVSFEEGFGHALLRDVAPRRLLHRLRSPYAGLRSVLLDDDANEVASDDASWLRKALPDPDLRGAVHLGTDAEGRVILTTDQTLALIDPPSLRLVALHRTASWPTPWKERSWAVFRSGDRELTVLDWS